MPAAAAQPSHTALELDVATSLALSRATSRAMSRLSADAQASVLRELAREADLQTLQGGRVAELVAVLISAYADDLK
jgi:hypothetical protein